VIKVYGHPMSTCTRKVLATLVETNTPYELELVDFAKGEHKQEPHLSRQPFGQVPAIDDAGVKLYESRAIARYVNERSQGSLVPKDVAARARMEQWISVETSNFTGSAMKFIFQHVFQRPQSAEVLAEAQKQLGIVFDVMDAQLAKQPYLAGEQFSLADVCFMPYVEYLQVTPIKADMEKRKHVSAWWQRVSERPSWRKVAARA
jgi:glutathione S-transferase